MKMAFRACGSLAIALLLISGCTESQSHYRNPNVPTRHNDVAAYNPQEYNTAYNQFLTRAKAGDPVAEYNLGRLYSDGRGAPEDDELAFKWFQKAAEAGDERAQVELGMAYLYGKGTRKDKHRACAWFKEASSQGSADGRHFYEANCRDVV